MVSAAGVLDEYPSWVSLVRAANPGPMTLDGTNTWVLRVPGADNCVLIDPGPLLDEHLARLAGKAPVGSILITHSHPDHVEGAARLAEQLGGVDVLAMDPSHSRPGPPLVGDRVLDQFGLTIQTLATPGHTSDSVCFVVSAEGQQVVFTGDTILGRGTTVVAHPDGNLGSYLDSLRRLAEFSGVPALPGHGPALADCAAAARFYLDHRLTRLDQVRAARESGAVSASEVVSIVYAAVDRVLWPAAEMSVRAQLAFLDQAKHDDTVRVPESVPTGDVDRESNGPSAGLDPP